MHTDLLDKAKETAQDSKSTFKDEQVEELSKIF